MLSKTLRASWDKNKFDKPRAGECRLQVPQRHGGRADREHPWRKSIFSRGPGGSEKEAGAAEGGRTGGKSKAQRRRGWPRRSSRH